MQKVRWGILGAARINERLLPAILAVPQAELVAIGSRRPGAALETLQRLAPEAHHVKTYDSLEAVLECAEIDAVYIPLANAEHASWVLKAIAAGKHVLCEKPLATCPEDILAIHQAASEQGVRVMEGFMYRFHPQHERVRELIASGLIGEVRSVRTSFSFMMKPARLYRIQSDIGAGGGAMWDIGCYAIHSARMWMQGSPRSVTAMMHCAESGADLSTSGIIEYGEGRILTSALNAPEDQSTRSPEHWEPFAALPCGNYRGISLKFIGERKTVAGAKKARPPLTISNLKLQAFQAPFWPVTIRFFLLKTPC